MQCSLSRMAWAMAAALAVSGCATAYRNEAATSLTGGGAQNAGPGKLVRIAFYGNGFTAAHKIARYAVFRAAEYAHAQGKPYFLLYPTLIHAAMDQPEDKPTVGIVDGKAIATAYVLPLDTLVPGALVTAALLEQLAAAEGARATPASSANGDDRT